MPEDGETTMPRRQPRVSTKDLLIVILAAGQGKRMRSARPKILHPLGGQPLVCYPIQLARQLGGGNIVLVHAPAEKVELAELAGDCTLVAQHRPLGTGHALNQVPPAFRQVPEVLVLYGDVPLLTVATVRRLLQRRRRGDLDCVLLAARLDEPGGYGRLVEVNGAVRIVEDTEATPEEAAVDLVNTGVCCFRAEALWPALRRLKKSSRTGEYYLTDVFAALDRRDLITCSAEEAIGINDRWQLAAAESVLRRRKNRELAEAGVTIVDPATTYIDPGVSVETDAVIHPFSFLRGRTTIGARSQIGPFAEISDCAVGRDCVIGRSHLVESVIEDSVDIGPFNRLRGGTVVAKGSRIGTHTEIKNTLVGPDSDVHHFAYLGDAVLGKGVNIGAGTVTANFDGLQKRQTVIGDDVFIGTDSTLVAPVSIGDRAYTAAGSVITADVAADALAIERNDQVEVPKWSQRRRKLASNPDAEPRSG